MMNRRNLKECFAVACDPYGKREIWYDSNRCSEEIVSYTRESWESIWREFQSACVGMITEEDNADWGNLEMLQDGWELHLDYPPFDEDDLPKFFILLSLIFIVDDEFRTCSWDVFLEDGKVTGCQPAF